MGELEWAAGIATFVAVVAVGFAVVRTWQYRNLEERYEARKLRHTLTASAEAKLRSENAALREEVKDLEGRNTSRLAMNADLLDQNNSYFEAFDQIEEIIDSVRGADD